MRAVLIAALCGASVPAVAQELPVTVVKRPIGDGGQAWDVILTIRGDRLDIRHIELNRGNCHATMPGKNGYPNPLRFGQQLPLRMFDCDPIEIKIEADQGVTIIDMPE